MKTVSAGWITRKCRSQVTVEFALLLVPLILIVFGGIDFLMVYQEKLRMDNAAREGARIAAVGGTTTQITNACYLKSARLTNMSVQMDYSTDFCTNWITLGTSGSYNSAPIDSYIRVRVTHTNTGVMNKMLGNMLKNRVVTNTAIIRRD